MPTHLTQERAYDPSTREAHDVIRYPTLLHQPGSIGYVEKMLIGQLLMIAQPKLIVETGAFFGQTTRFLLEFTELNGLAECRIASFDLPEVIEDLRKADNFFTRHTRVQFVAGRLPGSLKMFLGSVQEPVDFALVDAQHAYLPVWNELAVLHARLRPGAYVFCHDYREFDTDRDFKGVVYAVDRFVKEFGYDCLPLNHSMRGDRETVWGAALLRKPLTTRSWRQAWDFRIEARGRALDARLLRRLLRCLGPV